MDRWVIYLGGTYDLFHYGHVNILKKARKLAGTDGKVVVSLNTDEFVKKFKGKFPIMNYEERKKSLLACPYVDEVIKNIGGQDSKPAILKAKANVIVEGSDFARKDFYKQMGFTQDWLDEHDIVLAYVPYTSSISSTEIKERIKKQ